MRTLLKNGTLIDYKTNTFEKYDILIQEDKIEKIEKNINEEVDKIIDFDRTIYKKVRSILETVRNNREALDKIAEKYNLTMLPKDKVWQIRADIENRSSKNACINDTMNWICGVRSKSDGHEGILEENDQIIDDFIRWKLMIKEKYKTKQMINDDPAKRIKDFVKEIKVPEYSLEEKEKTSRCHRETFL